MHYKLNPWKDKAIHEATDCLMINSKSIYISWFRGSSRSFDGRLGQWRNQDYWGPARPTAWTGSNDIAGQGQRSLIHNNSSSVDFAHCIHLGYKVPLAISFSTTIVININQVFKRFKTIPGTYFACTGKVTQGWTRFAQSFVQNWRTAWWCLSPVLFGFLLLSLVPLTPSQKIATSATV